MSSINQHTRRGHKQFVVRAGLALATAAGVATGIAGFGAHAADAAGTHPFGTTNLIQSQDFSGFKENVGELNTQDTNLYGAVSISACTGEDSLDEITGNKNLTSIGSQWFSDLDDGTGYINETIVQAKTPAAAKAAANKVLKAVKSCQHEPKTHWRYGKVYNGPLKNGDNVWMDSYTGKGKNNGGISIMLQGKRFGVVEVQQSAGATGTGDDAIKNVSYQAQKRLAK
jgi:hypothetical protein